MKEIKELQQLRQEAGINKSIPLKYEKVILKALASYPELKHVKIHFKLTDKHPVPYGTTPAISSLLSPADKRVYYITLLEKAEGPEYAALFRNLTQDAQVAVIAHELVHVLQFHSCSITDLWKMMILYPFSFFKRKLEREADAKAIDHGFGSGLYAHAMYLRSIPGYIEKRPALDKYYLKPNEILERLGQQDNKEPGTFK
jgi:hypothetical protein